MLGLALGAAASRARADGADSATADRLFREAKELAMAGRYAEACPKLEQSQRLDPALGTQFNLADCYEHTGRPASAWLLFNEVMSLAHVAGKAERESAAKARADALEPHVPHLVLVVRAPDTPGLELTRDGTPVKEEDWGKPVPVDPGDHSVEAAAPAHKKWTSRVTIPTEGAAPTELVVPELEQEQPAPPPVVAPPPPSTPAPTMTAPPPAPVGSSQRTLGLFVAGLGVVGVLVGSVFGFDSLAKHNDATSSACPNGGACGDQGAVDAWQSARTAGNVSTVAFIAGGVALAGGLALWLTAPSASSGGARVGVAVGGSGMGVAGRW
jgi:hypothetical protein